MNMILHHGARACGCGVYFFFRILTLCNSFCIVNIINTFRAWLVLFTIEKRAEHAPYIYFRYHKCTVSNFTINMPLVCCCYWRMLKLNQQKISPTACLNPTPCTNVCAKHITKSESLRVLWVFCALSVGVLWRARIKSNFTV